MPLTKIRWKGTQWPSRKRLSPISVLHYQSGTSRINPHFADGSFSHHADLDPGRALLLIDILRNEKPIYWTDEEGILWTGKEPVSEGEVR